MVQSWGMSSSGSAPRVDGLVRLVPGASWRGRSGGQAHQWGELAFFFFFPGKGYSLSLGTVVIAGGGSGLNFHADALRSRQLVLQACVSGALTR